MLGLPAKIQEVQNYRESTCQIDLPQLKNSATILELKENMINTFTHINMLFKSNQSYDPQKYKNLIENYSVVITEVLIRILKDKRIMHVSAKEMATTIEAIKNNIKHVWSG